jgi:hypothetical protein
VSESSFGTRLSRTVSTVKKSTARMLAAWASGTWTS